MASLFEPIELTWRDQKYTIPASRVLMAIARVEEVVTLQEITAHQSGIGMAKLAMAYGTLLRFAGAKATDEEVYVNLFGGGGIESSVVVTALLLVMVPKAVSKRIEEMNAKSQAGQEAPAEGKAEAPTAEAS